MEEYTRESVTVNTLSPLEPIGTAVLNALFSPYLPLPDVYADTISTYTYVWALSIDRLAPTIWHYNDFVRKGLSRWLGSDADKYDEYSGVDERRAMNGTIIPPHSGVDNSIQCVPKSNAQDVQFGHSMLKNFCFAPSYINLNHGGST